MWEVYVNWKSIGSLFLLVVLGRAIPEAFFFSFPFQFKSKEHKNRDSVLLYMRESET